MNSNAYLTGFNDYMNHAEPYGGIGYPAESEFEKVAATLLKKMPLALGFLNGNKSRAARRAYQDLQKKVNGPLTEEILNNWIAKAERGAQGGKIRPIYTEKPRLLPKKSPNVPTPPSVPPQPVPNSVPSTAIDELASGSTRRKKLRLLSHEEMEQRRLGRAKGFYNREAFQRKIRAAQLERGAQQRALIKREMELRSPAAQAPASNAPSGSIPAANAPSGSIPASNAPSGSIPAANTPASNTKSITNTQNPVGEFGTQQQQQQQQYQLPGWLPWLAAGGAGLGAGMLGGALMARS